MKIALSILTVFICGTLSAQDPWKNIYSAHAWEERDQWQKADALIAFMDVGSGKTVADIGCHEGYMTFKLARVVGGEGLVYAVDLSASKLEKVAKRASEAGLAQVRTVRGDDDNPNLPPGSVDAVIILDTYHEIDNPAEILQHIRVALKPGGRLVISDPIADSRRNVSRPEQKKKHELAMHYALDDLRKAGFRIVIQRDKFIDRTKEKGDHMWVIVARNE